MSDETQGFPLEQASPALSALAEPFAPFALENQRLASLAGLEPVASIGALHPLTEGVWLSFEADKGVEMSILPSDTGFALEMADVGSAHWVSLSFALSAEAVRSGRYVAFVVRAASEGFLSYRPYLRYLHEEGFTDQPARDFMVSSGGEKEQLCPMKIDQDALERSHAVEAHFFFQGSNFRADFRSIEVVLIV